MSGYQEKISEGDEKKKMKKLEIDKLINLLKLQARHGQLTGKQIYRVLVNIVKHLSIQLINMF